MSKHAKRIERREGLDEEAARAEAASQALRDRRRAATPAAPISKDIHRELPLTRVAVGLLVCLVASYLIAQVAGSMGALEVARIASIATTVLFIMAFIAWFVSRHQAKKLTRAAHEDERQS